MRQPLGPRCTPSASTCVHTHTRRLAKSRCLLVCRGRAANGDLTVMVGGDEDVVERVGPVLRAIGSKVEHMGGPGSGAAMKLANQLLASVHAVAAAEAMTLARSLGLRDTAQVLRVVSSSSGTSLAFSRGAALLAELEATHVSVLRSCVGH